jgi:c-di-GMP-binding flagellar brake protein YcgR
MALRRRAPRVVTPGWLGTYFVEDDSRAGWGDCRVLDLSIIGVGLELFGAIPDGLIGHRIVVQISVSVGTSVSLRLVGEVRNATDGPQGGNRVGMEFVDLSETERAIISVIEKMGAAW